MNVLDCTQIHPRLYQGAKPPPGPFVSSSGFNVLVLTAFEYQPRSINFPGVARVIHVPLDDGSLDQDTHQRAWRAARDIANAHTRGARILVTCQQGRNRSGLVTALATWLLTDKPGASIVKIIQARRKDALTNPAFANALMALPRRSKFEARA